MFIAAAVALVAGAGGGFAQGGEAVTYGAGPAYAKLGSLPVEHAGRVKPLDTVAREVVKIVHSRETIKLLGPDGEVAEYWRPMAAFLDWSVRPEVWDERDFLRIESIDLKHMMLQAPTRKAFEALAARFNSAGDKKAIDALLALPAFTEESIAKAAASAAISQELKKALLAEALKFNPEHTWVSPRLIETAKVDADGQSIDFEAWVRELDRRARAAADSAQATASFTFNEKKARELYEHYMFYRVVRDRMPGSDLSLRVIPRPYDDAYIKYLGGVMQGFMDGKLDEMSLSRLQDDSGRILQSYLENIKQEKRKVPGTDPAFDKPLKNWLAEGSEWMGLPLLLENDPADLASAGFSSSRTSALRAAYRGVIKSEEDHPGNLDLAAATQLVAAARDLGTSTNPAAYPSPRLIGLETHYNAFGPFFRAPGFYLIGFVLLFAALVSPRSDYFAAQTFANWCRMLGMAAFIGGIALEIYGFALRIVISGWAPVTNMYETVIWVSLIAAVVGLGLEIVYKKTYPAMAGSFAAGIGTLLAANTSLDPGIRSLQPVLRSNLWLSIHVLTEVSSYAAFAVAWALGVFATIVYLGATYKRDAGLKNLALPIWFGAPALAIGLAGYFSLSGAESSALLSIVPAGLAVLGAVLCGVGLVSILGELAARRIFKAGEWSGPPGDAPEFGAAESHAQNGTSKRTGRVLQLAAAPALPADGREACVQETSALVKMIIMFIYRAMQVGVLLITAGTFLGGVWADYSWGRFWGWDPKEVWALITLLIYIIPLHGRFAGWINNFGMVMASLVCFLSVVMAWYGVNAVLGVGLHAYGFMEGAGQGAVGAACLGFLSLGGAAAWRRYVAKHASATVAELVAMKRPLVQEPVGAGR